MTIITAARADAGLCLVADRIYSPFDSPRLMVAPKIVECAGYQIGISGRIVNNGVEELLKSPEQFLDYDYNATDTHIILITPTFDVYIRKCNDECPTWYRPLALGEPPTIGCFAGLMSESLAYGELPTVELAASRITWLHRAYGFNVDATVSCAPTE